MDQVGLVLRKIARPDVIRINVSHRLFFSHSFAHTSFLEAFSVSMSKGIFRHGAVFGALIDTIDSGRCTGHLLFSVHQSFGQKLLLAVGRPFLLDKDGSEVECFTPFFTVIHRAEVALAN